MLLNSLIKRNLKLIVNGGNSKVVIRRPTTSFEFQQASSHDLSNKLKSNLMVSNKIENNSWKTLQNNRFFSTTSATTKNLNNVDQKNNNSTTTTNTTANTTPTNTTTTTPSSSSSKPNDRKFINVIFIDKSGKKIEVKAPLGMNMLEVAHKNDIDLEGACECSLACSTCHVILEQKYYKTLPEPSDEENDMLDLAFGLTETSRLGCQIIAKPELEGMVLELPQSTRNMYVDGAKPHKH